MASTICEYEQARLKRIRDNQLKLKELGVKQAVSLMQASQRVPEDHCKARRTFTDHKVFKILTPRHIVAERSVSVILKQSKTPEGLPGNHGCSVAHHGSRVHSHILSYAEIWGSLCQHTQQQ